MIRRRAREAIVVALATATACAGQSKLHLAPSKGGFAWRELSSPHFRLQTDLDEEDARHLAAEIERFRAAILEGTAGLDKPARVRIVALRDREELWEFTSRNLGGFMAEIDGAPFVAFPFDEAWSWVVKRNTPLHELTHVFTAALYPGAPAWYSEGMACYFETAEVEWLSPKVVVGRLRQDLDVTVRESGRLSLDELWHWPNPVTSPVKTTLRYYASAWLWIHFLRNKHRAELRDFEARLGRGEVARAAFVQAFSHSSPETLQQDLGTYMNRILDVETFSPPLAPEPSASRLLSDADYFGVRAVLAAYGIRGTDPTWRRERVEREASAASSLDPLQPDALVLQVQWASSPQERVERARDCTQRRPDLAQCWLALAGSTAPGGDPRERDEALDKARALAPEDPAIVAALALRASARGQRDEALRFSLEAVRASPWSATSWLSRARALRGAGQCEEAREAWSRAAERQGEISSALGSRELGAEARALDEACPSSQ